MILKHLKDLNKDYFATSSTINYKDMPSNKVNDFFWFLEIVLFFHCSDQYAFVIVCKVVGWGEGGVQFAAKTTDAMVRFKSMYTDYFFFEK